MSFVDKITAGLPFGKKEEVSEYFFALNIGAETLTAALWRIHNKELQIISVAEERYKSLSEISSVCDKLLDTVIGVKNIDPQKILFGVPDSWLQEENLKEEYLKLLRSLVKEFELTPLAYVAASHAVVHLQEKKEGIPTTAIYIDVETNNLSVTVVRAGKIDGTKSVRRGDDLGVDVEKALMQFQSVETLPSKFYVFGKNRERLEKEKGKLLSFPWMSRLSFLHLPKIEILDNGVAIASVCYAGASELVGEVSYKHIAVLAVGAEERQDILHEEVQKIETAQVRREQQLKEHEDASEQQDVEAEESDNDLDAGFRLGDVSEDPIEGIEEKNQPDEEVLPSHDQARRDHRESNLIPREIEQMVETVEDQLHLSKSTKKSVLKKVHLLKNFKTLSIFAVAVLVISCLVGAYILVPKARIKVFVEPKILEKSTEVTADPKQREIDEVAKIIPAEIVETEVSGSDKESATGKREIGDPAKGVVKIYNATANKVTIPAGTTLTSDSGIKFELDKAVDIASKSASAADPPTESGSTGATAKSVGPDGNISSGSELKVGSFGKSEVVAKSEGNFSGGTSQTVTVVSDADQKRLLAKLTSALRQQAQQKLQEKLLDKKIIEEGLSETVVKKSFSKNINDQAGEFTLNLTATYKGTAFDESDLKTFVSKLITTEVPSGFMLNIADTETQSDISKLEKDGRIIFSAKFRAKLVPSVDSEKVKDLIKGKTPTQALEEIKKIEHVLGGEIEWSPSLPEFLQRLPFLTQNIQVEVGLK